MKNYGDLGGCYLPRPIASMDNTLRDLHNSSQDTQPHSLIVKYCTSTGTCMPQQYYFNPFTTWTFMCDNPPIPWQFSVENKHTRAPKINHMRSKTRDKLWLSNKLFLLDELMGSQGM